MDELTLLSPHRDDAAFSLSICLSQWRRTPVRLTILNFFTQSAYAPHALLFSSSSISAIRAREDRQALRAIDARIRIESAGLIDAPLRLGIEAHRVCDLKPGASDDSPDLRTVRAAIRGHAVRGLAIAPLGLGNHVDHLLVSRAATDVIPGKRLAFYEDLPYATWTPDRELINRVSECETRTRVVLKSAILRIPHGLWRKREVGFHYSSQIAPGDAADIARYSARYGGGERIWIPRYSSRWTSLLNCHA